MRVYNFLPGRRADGFGNRRRNNGRTKHSWQRELRARSSHFGAFPNYAFPNYADYERLEFEAG